MRCGAECPDFQNGICKKEVTAGPIKRKKVGTPCKFDKPKK